jgi:type VI secretion system (T6SS) immunity protein Tdi1
MEALTIPLEGLDRDHLLDDWSWLLPEPYRLLAVTRMGDAFVEAGDGKVVFLDTLEGCLRDAATSERAFFTLLEAGKLDPVWFLPNMVALMEARGVSLAPGQCYSYQVPPAFGGPLTSQNVRAVSARVHFSVTGQLHQQIKDLPPGAQITGFNIVE